MSKKRKIDAGGRKLYENLEAEYLFVLQGEIIVVFLTKPFQ